MKLNIYLITLLLLISSIVPLPAKSRPAKSKRVKLRIERTVTEKYPDMDVYISVTNRNHTPLLSLVKGNFSAIVDGKRIEDGVDVAGFQYTEEGVAYSLLIAGNGMMQGECIEEQLKAAVVLLESLREQDTLSVYVFSEEVKTVFEFQNKDENLVEKITKIEVLGGNPHLYDAIVFAARRFASIDMHRKVLIVMTDGRETGSRYNEKQMINVLDEEDIPVYSIGLKIMAGQNLYKINSISSHTGGDYIYAPRLNRTSKILELITREILFGYRIKFRVDHVKGDDQLHQLQIKAVVKDNEASFFKNFVARKIPFSTLAIIVISVIVLIILILFIILFVFQLRKTRKEIGVSGRKCPVCRQRMKDDWDECIFCKYETGKKGKNK